MDIKNQTKTRAFNPFLRAKSDKLKNLIEEVQAQIEGYEVYYEKRKRARRAADQVTFERMIEALVCFVPCSPDGRCTPSAEQQSPA